jgi:hypothetical protein
MEESLSIKKQQVPQSTANHLQNYKLHNQQETKLTLFIHPQNFSHKAF